MVPKSLFFINQIRCWRCAKLNLLQRTMPYRCRGLFVWVGSSLVYLYSRVGFRRTQGLEPQPAGVLIFQNLAILFLFPASRTRRAHFRGNVDTYEYARYKLKLCSRYRKRDIARCRLRCWSNVEAKDTLCLWRDKRERLIVRVCMYSRKNIVLNLKIPAWAVLKFWGFSSLSVLRQSVLRDPTLL